MIKKKNDYKNPDRNDEKLIYSKKLIYLKIN